MGSETHAKVPVINFSKETLKPGTNSWSLTCKEVRRAIEEYGTFLAIYDKVSEELEKAIYNAGKELFDLPIESKERNNTERTYHGYVGDVPVIPLHESTGIDNATTLEGVQKFTSLMWPNGNEKFSETVLSYSKLVAELDQMIQKMIFESYGVDKYFEPHKESSYYLLRLMKYRVPDASEGNLGFRPHTDKSFAAIIQQLYLDGLEIETKDGQWIACELLPYSYVYLAGDALMGWSNGRIQSAKHRVILNTKEVRYSTGVFSFSTGMIQVPEELVDDQNPLRYKSFDHQSFLRFFETEEGRNAVSPIQVYSGV
uniref:Fe2OG dioxygenase domain-containing protein n=1 Tax=Fagus sylvatica TaxID=28930 RepID=A0A2N9IBG1_FAGSY